MKTVRRLLYRDIVYSVMFVALAFLSLFYFIDFVDELDGVGKGGRTVGGAVITALYALPGHAYELAPIAVLIGTIYSLARLAQSSEFTILRTGGLGPQRALTLLAALGVAFGSVTFVIGDFVAPVSERLAVLHKARQSGGHRVGAAGAWLKEKRSTPEGERSVSVNVSAIDGDGTMLGIRIFEFDADGRLVRRIASPSGTVGDDGHWRLANAQVLDWPTGAALGSDDAQVRQATELSWPSSLDRQVVAAALLPAETMTTLELWRYSAHLSDQEQAAQRHEVQFWKKAFYPLACIVMVALALPFAYMHARAGSVSLKVFGGIMLGISFVLLNNVAGHLGVLSDWTPWMVAAAPSLLYLLLSLAAFTWLVRYR
jgi:lipopolysaccharide export system permease protein